MSVYMGNLHRFNNTLRTLVGALVDPLERVCKTEGKICVVCICPL